MNVLTERMKSRREELGLNQKEVAKKAGIKQQSYQATESGKTLKPRFLLEIASALDCSVDYLLGNEDLADNSQNDSATVKNNGFVIEVLNVSASAGYGGASSDVKEVIKLVEYNEHEAMLLFGNIKAQNIKIINISGDSMEPTFESGDSLFVDVSKTEFDSDGMYVFTYQESLFVKRLQKIGENLRVLSDNPLYENWGIEKENFDQIYIHGKVMFSQSMKLKRFG